MKMKMSVEVRMIGMRMMRDEDESKEKDTELAAETTVELVDLGRRGVGDGPETMAEALGVDEGAAKERIDELGDGGVSGVSPLGEG